MGAAHLLPRGPGQDPRGKLKAAGRAWATGALGGDDGRDEAAEDAALWGLELTEEALAPGPDEGIWEENQPALLAFLSVATQWRVAAGPMGGVIPLGLDYAGARAGLELAEVKTTPALWADIQAIEAGALEAMREER